MKSALRWASLTFVGMILVQTAWLLAMPPYHAMDEFDHVYRAAGVASGQWLLTDNTPNGRGVGVVVPDDIVDAASAQCASLGYTRPDNCFPVEIREGGDVLISTAAGSYHPAYYWVVGTAAQHFEGDKANYAMRSISAVVSAFGIAFAAFCLALVRAGPWTRTGFVVSLTPVLIYTTIIPAPNAWEIVAGLCLWCSLLAVFLAPIGQRQGRLLVVSAAVSGCVLVTPRMLGPMWLGLIVIAVAIYVGRETLFGAIRRNWLTWAIGAGVVTAATLASAWWTLAMDLNEPSPERVVGEDEKTLTRVATRPVVWLLGTVGSFPFRDQPAPMGTYVLYFVVVCTLLWMGIRCGYMRERVAVGGVVVLSVMVPVVLTLLTLENRGTTWQGRYGLPFVVGVLLLAGLTLDRASWASQERRRLIPLALMLVGIAQVWSVISVLKFELERVETVPSPSWISPSAVLVGSLISFGWLLLAVVPLSRSRRSRRPTKDGGFVQAMSENLNQTTPSSR